MDSEKTTTEAAPPPARVYAVAPAAAAAAAIPSADASSAPSLLRAATMSSAAASSGSASSSSSSVIPAGPPPLSKASSWSGDWAGVTLGMMSAAKAALKLAPVVVEGALGVASSSTDNLIHYTRRGVELGTGAVRGGIVYTGQAAALHLERLAAEAADEEQQAKYAGWARGTKRTTAALDRGLERGGDLLENHVLGAVNRVAQGGISVAAFSAKTSLRTTGLLLGAADVTTKWALRAKGVDVASHEEEHCGHEETVDCILKIVGELRALNKTLDEVGTAELIRTLLTYARLVETVESDSMYRSRRLVLSSYLATIGQERKAQAARKEQEANIACITSDNSSSSSSSVSARGAPLPRGAGVAKAASAAAPIASPPVAAAAASSSSSSSKGSAGGWFSWWSTPAADSKKTTEESKMPEGPAPSIPADPAPSTSQAYEDGLYMLAGSGMRKVSRAMLFAGCAYGPRFMRFLGVPTTMVTHEAFIVEQCAIAPEDILLADFNSSLKHPGFFLALDHQSKQVLLVIRGSSALHDALTDLTCSFTRHVSGEFGSKGGHGHAEGFVHEGMFKSAQWFAQNLRGPILAALKDHPDYGLVLAGHSLGGGVGSLLALLWLHDREMNPPARRMQGFFFGSPCVVTAELSHLGYGFVWNFVLGHDVVCRLSKGAIEDLCGVVLALTVQSREVNSLNKMPSKERRVEKARREAAKAQAMEVAKRRNKPPTHPASQDYTALTAMLDRYHALQERVKNEGPDAPLQSAAEAAAIAAAIPASIVEESSIDPSAPDPAVRTLRLESASLLADLHSILQHLRRGMTNEKLFPLGHIFHLLPRGEAVNAEDNKEKSEAARLEKELGGSAAAAAAPTSPSAPIPVAEAVAAASASSSAAASSSSSSAASPAPSSSAASPAPIRRKVVQVSRVDRLQDIIGATTETLEVDAEGGAEIGIAGAALSAVAPAAAAATAAAAAALPTDTMTDASAAAAISSSPSPLRGVSVRNSPATSAASSRNASPARSRGGSASASASPGPSAGAAAASSSPCPAPHPPRPTLPIARPVLSRPSSLSRPPSLLAAALSRVPSLSRPLSGDKRKLAPADDATSSLSTSASAATDDMQDVEMSSDAEATAAAAEAAAVAAAESSMASISAAAYTPPLAAPIAPPPKPQPENLFTHPPPYDIVAGHWSDLTDLILSSSMLQHHLPAAYFVALATHETTKQQSADEKILAELAAEREMHRSNL